MQTQKLATQPRETLLAIANSARNWLKMWAKDFTPAEATQAGGTAVNPLAWQLGHIACTQDDAYKLFSGKPGVAPQDLRAVCGNGCPLPTAGTRYPPLSELWDLLDRTQAQLVGLIEKSSEDDFERPPLKENPFFKTLGQATYDISLHENYHVGMIATLRKALGKKSIG